MAESHTGRAPARRESPTNTTGPASPPPLARSVAPLAELQHLAGNSATTALLRGPAGGRDARSSGVSGLGAAVRSAAVPPLAAARAEAQREAHAAGGAATAAPASPGKAAAGGATAGDVGGAEAWLRDLALRGKAPRPAEAVPAVYSGALQALQSAIGGPGPFPAEQLVVDELAF